MKNINTRNLQIPDNAPAILRTMLREGARQSGFSQSSPIPSRDVPENKTGKIGFTVSCTIFAFSKHPGNFILIQSLLMLTMVYNRSKRFAKLVNRKIRELKWVYYEWMEKFIDMEYENKERESTPGRKNPWRGPTGNLWNDYLEKYRRYIKDPLNDNIKKAAGMFEKHLIVIQRFFTAEPDMQTPELEITNTGMIFMRDGYPRVIDEQPRMAFVPDRASSLLSFWAAASIRLTRKRNNLVPEQNFLRFSISVFGKAKRRTIAGNVGIFGKNNPTEIPHYGIACLKNVFHSQSP